mgnify:CR=1 FL=1
MAVTGYGRADKKQVTTMVAKILGLAELPKPADAADALHERAVAAGATITQGLRDEDYGSRGFTCRDPEGVYWSFGTYAGE